MKQPKVYVKSERKVFDKKKVFDAKEIHFDIDVVAIDDGVNFDYCELDFSDVEFMDNTGFKDKKGNYIYLGDIVEIVGTLFEVKYKIFKGYAIENKEYTLSLEANFDTATVIGNIYENKELLEDI